MAVSAALVWFKRDLRVLDHAPLQQAQAFEHALALFIIEPEWLQSAECSAQHVQFSLLCLAELRTTLSALGLPLLVRVGPATQVLQSLRNEFNFSHLLSHEETSSGWTYTRDKAVAAWCRQQGVQWTEHPQTGVVRRLRSRSGWAARWAARMHTPVAALQGGLRAAPGFAMSAQPRLPSLRDLVMAQATQPLPAAGEAAAWQILQSFLAGRGRDYRRAMSSPLSAGHSCSRLSAHLAFGSISMRSVHQATEAAINVSDDVALNAALRSFAGRLRWHCHFMQKLEDEPQIEFLNFARSHDGLRAGDGVNDAPSDQAKFDAWCHGHTGFPMVDACMRQLRATGWLNFRMRAMLVSFAAYHLWLHWRAPGLHLARLFLDFEPGIHWSQMQMQSGTTGINTLRIYSPSKQALDQDPQGHYIRRWLPEFGSAAYPKPIVDEREAVAAAKQRLFGLRKSDPARQDAQAVQQKHGSRKSGLPQTARKSTSTRTSKDHKAPGQGELF
jgi:deoxyribodipyrimidine photo-lyase